MTSQGQSGSNRTEIWSQDFWLQSLSSEPLYQTIFHFHFFSFFIKKKNKLVPSAFFINYVKLLEKIVQVITIGQIQRRGKMGLGSSLKQFLVL